jgi:uncharacterized Rmd1/YagE family protein
VPVRDPTNYRQEGRKGSRDFGKDDSESNPGANNNSSSSSSSSSGARHRGRKHQGGGGGNGDAGGGGGGGSDSYASSARGEYFAKGEQESNRFSLSASGSQEIFIFDFGGVVFWGFGRGEETNLLKTIRMFVTKGFVGVEEYLSGEDDMAFVVTPDATTSKYNTNCLSNYLFL